MMRRGLRFAMRLTASLAVFEVLTSFRWVFSDGLSVGTFVAALTMPFFVYGLLAWPLAVLCGLRLPGRGLPVGAAAATAIPLAWIAYFGKKNAIFLLGGTNIVWYLVGLAGALAVLLLRSERLDRGLPKLMLAAGIPGLIGLAMTVLKEESGYTTPYAAAADAQLGAVAGGEQPDLLLISWDTVRADVLGPWGATGTDTPNFDRLVAEGVLFEDAVASTPITGPSHATMLTGLYPPSHGLRSNITMPMGEVPTLPELLAGVGYRTGGFISAYPLLGRYGFDRGFHRYDDRMLTNRWTNLTRLRSRSWLWMAALHGVIPRTPTSYTKGEVVNQRAFEWMAQSGDEPRFVFLHYYDAHGPFEPPAALREKYLARADTLQPPVFSESLKTEWALYRAEIEQVDQLLGEVLAMQEQRDPGLQNTLVVLTSDHGECFGEGGIELNHVPSLYEATQHIPMVVRFPGAAGAGTRVAETVTHLDLVPTLLAAGGVDENLVPGADLSYPLQRVLNGGLGYEQRPVYLEAQQEILEREQDRKQGWRTREWKLIEVETGERRLYRYREGEESNLAADYAEQVTELADTLSAFFEGLPKAKTKTLSRSAADESAMAGLGYAEAANAADDEH